MVESKQASLAFLVAIVIAVVLCIYFTLLVASVKKSSGAIELECRINPNDASPVSLARLPGIGLVRAEAIAAYREQFHKNGRGDFAFRNCSDLMNVKGIGPITAEKMCVWLKFK